MKEINKNNINNLEKKLKDLLERKINSTGELEKWLKDRTRVYDEVEENQSRSYYAFCCHNDNDDIKEAYMYHEEVIAPLFQKYEAELDKFFYNNEYKNKLDKKFDLLIKKCVNSIELFRKDNIDLEVEESKYCAEYYDITGSQTVEWNGEEKTLQQIGIYLNNQDRKIREKAWRLSQGRRLKDAEKLDELMNKLVEIRNKKALNAGCKDFRDYMFKSMERFSYTPLECEKFHNSVLKYVVPLSVELHKEHQMELGLSDFKPWDIDGVLAGEKTLRPYKTIDELIEKAIIIFDEKDKVFGDTLRKMKESGTLDLESRRAKSPGGFCCYFPISKVSCIFNNGECSHEDVIALTHEGGHSIHDTLSGNIPFHQYRNMPIETAELSSMGMELICMDRWDIFYSDEEELKRAKREYIGRIIKFIIPWAILIDKFQHWIYLNPKHTADERNNEFEKLVKEFKVPYGDFTGFGDELKHFWKKQLHIFEVPFYFIEYAMAQLGAIQIWRNYIINPEKTISDYKKALALGGSVSIPEVYEAAGIKFDFSEDIIKELMKFVKNELDKLK